MRPTRRAVLGMVATTSLAGCFGGDGGDDGGGTDDQTDAPTDTATDTPTATPTGTDADAGPATVQVESHAELGEILVGPEGLTLYMFDQDTMGEGASACYDDCAATWPPLTVEDAPAAGDDVAAELTTFEREDGATQVAANGWPLYYYANDGEPGDANGQGVGDIWWVLRPDGTPVRPGSNGQQAATVQVRSHPELGEILAGPEGLTLYMFDQDTKGAGASACSGGCATTWPPLTVEDAPAAGGDVTAELTTFEREDGATQVAANGWPLYYYANDGEPGDVNGQGVGDIWWVLDSAGAPRKPAEATETANSRY